MTDERAETRVAIVGGGPIGIELAAALQEAGVAYRLFEARQIGHTISWWPRETEFFSTSERLAIAGVPIQTTHQGRITGETYLAYLRSVVEQFDLAVSVYEPVRFIHRHGHGFTLETERRGVRRTTHCEAVVLATGDMAVPRRLGVPGEDLPHVSHYFTDPHMYFRTRLLVVGGKNSAVEAALRCWRAGADVSISYRGARFDERRVKAHLLPDLQTQIELGNIGFWPETVPVRIDAGGVHLAPVRELAGAPGAERTLGADFVLLMTGWEADMQLFEMAGVALEGERRAPRHDPETMETDVPGLYVAGTAAAGTQSRYTLFIENSHAHVGRIVQHLTGRWPERLGTIPSRRYDLPLEEIEAN